MKKKYACMLSCFIGLIIIHTTCTNEYWFKKMTCEGTLYDTIGGHPVNGIWVSLDACTNGPKSLCTTYHVGQNITDASGHFVIHNNAAREGRYFLYVNGYSYCGPVYESDLNKYYKIIYLKR